MAPSFTFLLHFSAAQFRPGMHVGFPQHSCSLSAARVPTPSRATIKAMRTTFLMFMVFSPWDTWLPATIVVPWVIKCLAELLLLWMALSRRVKYVWALAMYSFWTTLGLMILADQRFSRWGLANSLVSFGGGAIMLLVAWGLIDLLRRGRREYGGVAMIYLLLCASQVVVEVLPRYVHAPGVANALALWSWPGFVLWLAWECRSIPRLRLDALSVAASMMRDLTG